MRWKRYFSCLICGILILSAAPARGQDSLAVDRHKSSPTGALLRSALIPGWGQLYNGKYIKAGIFAVGEGYLIWHICRDWRDANRHESNFKSSTDPQYQALEFDQFKKAEDRRNIKIWILALTVFYSMFDAYVDAHLADFDQADEAFEISLSSVNGDGIGMLLTVGLP